MLDAATIQKHINTIDRYIDLLSEGRFDMPYEQAIQAAVSAKNIADAFRFILNPVTDMELINVTRLKTERRLFDGTDPEILAEEMQIPVELFEAMMLERIRQNVLAVESCDQN